MGEEVSGGGLDRGDFSVSGRLRDVAAKTSGRKSASTRKCFSAVKRAIVSVPCTELLTMTLREEKGWEEG